MHIGNRNGDIDMDQSVKINRNIDMQNGTGYCQATLRLLIRCLGILDSKKDEEV